VVYGRRRENLRSMILTVPGPIRHSSSLSKIEEMILRDEIKLDEQQKAAGIKLIGGDEGISVQITNVSFLETYEQVLTPEEEATIRARNLQVLEERKKRDAALALATSKDDPAGTPN
jgi:hypothetical protein